MILALRMGDTCFVETVEQRDQLVASGRVNVIVTTESQREVAMRLLKDGYKQVSGARDNPLPFTFFPTSLDGGQLAITGDPVSADLLEQGQNYVALFPLGGG